MVDFGLLEGKSEIPWEDENWPVRWSATTARPTTMRATTARVLARFPDGTPALVVNRVGRWQVLFCNAPFEQQLEDPCRLTAGAAHRFYHWGAEVAGVLALVPKADPDLEAVPGHRNGRQVAVLVNHGELQVATPDDGDPIEPMGWRVVGRSRKPELFRLTRALLLFN